MEWFLDQVVAVLLVIALFAALRALWLQL